MNAVAESGDLVARAMTRADIPLVDAIEKQSYPYPWTAGIFVDCIRAGYFCPVFAGGSGVVAYAVMSVAAGEAHILNLCVAPDHRRAGVGRRLLQHVVDAARLQGAEHLFLEVRPSNAAARSLYEQAGFNRVAVRPDYYPDSDGREDALILALDLTPPALPS